MLPSYVMIFIDTLILAGMTVYMLPSSLLGGLVDVAVRGSVLRVAGAAVVVRRAVRVTVVVAPVAD